jgi:hypothetical protein
MEASDSASMLVLLTGRESQPRSKDGREELVLTLASEPAD